MQDEMTDEPEKRENTWSSVNAKVKKRVLRIAYIKYWDHVLIFGAWYVFPFCCMFMETCSAGKSLHSYLNIATLKKKVNDKQKVFIVDD